MNRICIHVCRYWYQNINNASALTFCMMYTFEEYEWLSTQPPKCYFRERKGRTSPIKGTQPTPSFSVIVIKQIYWNEHGIIWGTNVIAPFPTALAPGIIGMCRQFRQSLCLDVCTCACNMMPYTSLVNSNELARSSDQHVRGN